MGGQSAFAFIDPSDSHRVDYYFMGDSALADIRKYLKEPYNVMKDCAATLLEGNCTLQEYKSRKFQEEHDLVGACIIMPDSIVCYDSETIVIYRRRRGE
uniref:Uncharacterized protein n=1 Tax=viral metagenome TaxID=1070528 RepID=A0A6C0DQD3_9ZZZZ